ncbi:MAG TPA: cobyrinic acid a,c-diamide synthase [Mycobacteriales bacterium]|nr:cobyrinic acid a,c-diamide synthase [Mycobacteriales bacterium]
MPRRVALPGADELFRSTGSVQRPAEDADGDTLLLESGQLPLAGTAAPAEVPERAAVAAPQTRPSGPRRPSGRQRHEEKITVYVSPSELVDLEHARLILRAEHSLAVDRGRIVREALAVVLADLESKGEQSILVRRLRGR